MRRRHRVLTVPSGTILFACIALPGYRECGHTVEMRQEPLLVVICLVGLVVALGALFARRRIELAVAIGSCTMVGTALGILAFGLAMVTPAYAGMTIGAAAVGALFGGTVLWILELRGKPIGAALVLTCVVSAGAVVVAAVHSTWRPPPPEHSELWH